MTYNQCLVAEWLLQNMGGLRLRLIPKYIIIGSMESSSLPLKLFHKNILQKYFKSIEAWSYQEQNCECLRFCLNATWTEQVNSLRGKLSTQLWWIFNRLLKIFILVCTMFLPLNYCTISSTCIWICLPHSSNWTHLSASLVCPADQSQRSLLEFPNRISVIIPGKYWAPQR